MPSKLTLVVCGAARELYKTHPFWEATLLLVVGCLAFIVGCFLLGVLRELAGLFFSSQYGHLRKEVRELVKESVECRWAIWRYGRSSVESGLWIPQREWQRIARALGKAES